MLHKFVDAIRHLHYVNGFELYLSSLQRSGQSGIPTMDEARRDYQYVNRIEKTIVS
jgi:hypothetical protein